MSDLVVFDFDGTHTADDVPNKLRSLQMEQSIDLEGACVVEPAQDGKVYIKQAVNLTALGAAHGGLSGALWGTPVGFHFLDRLAEMVIVRLGGAVPGPPSGPLTDHRINDHFVRRLGQTTPPESARLVLRKSFAPA